MKESRRRSRVSPLLRLLTLGLSGRFWLHASLPRFRQIGFLWPWQSLALPLAVILGFLSLMEAQTVSSIHHVTPPAAGGTLGEPNDWPKSKPDAPLAPQCEPSSEKHHKPLARSRVPVVVYTSSGQKYQSAAIECNLILWKDCRRIHFNEQFLSHVEAHYASTGKKLFYSTLNVTWKSVK